MKPEIKQAWLEALRSGAYQQGQGELHPTPETYCCLGVLCDLHRTLTGKGVWNTDGGEDDVSYTVIDDPEEPAFVVLPATVMTWAGLTRRDPYIPAETRRLAGLNDNGKSFAEIADLIERYL